MLFRSKLAAEYPETPQGKRAAGVLVFRKLKDNPLALAFTSTTGEAVDAAKHRGKVVLVYFWTTGDESSKANMELLVKVDKALGDRGLVVLGVCMSTEQAAMESECKASGASWPEYFDGKRWDNEMATKLGIREFPTTILADRSGKVREVGLLAEPLVDAVRKLLDETGK